MCSNFNDGLIPLLSVFISFYNKSRWSNLWPITCTYACMKKKSHLYYMPRLYNGGKLQQMVKGVAAHARQAFCHLPFYNSTATEHFQQDLSTFKMYLFLMINISLFKLQNVSIWPYLQNTFVLMLGRPSAIYSFTIQLQLSTFKRISAI